jgi:hypothetical protein
VFDFRYHLASLAAVFIAIVLGILVGIGLSGRGFVNDAERSNLEGRIADLQSQRDAAIALVTEAERSGSALDEYTNDTYLALVRSRLPDAAIGTLFVGPVDQGVSGAVERAVRDAGGSQTRLRSLTVPLDGPALDKALRDRPALRRYAGPDARGELGRALGREFVRGGATPLWDAVSALLVAEQSGPLRPPIGGAVVARTAQPQSGETKDFLSGLYRGLGRSGAVGVGVDSATADTAAAPAFRRAGLSTVDSIERSHGRVALVALLAGSSPGSYGVEDNALDGVLPPVPALTGRPG